jgi:hypothetical protein
LGVFLIASAVDVVNEGVTLTSRVALLAILIIVTAFVRALVGPSKGRGFYMGIGALGGMAAGVAFASLMSPWIVKDASVICKIEDLARETTPMQLAAEWADGLLSQLAEEINGGGFEGDYGEGLYVPMTDILRLVRVRAGLPEHDRREELPKDHRGDSSELCAPNAGYILGVQVGLRLRNLGGAR